MYVFLYLLVVPPLLRYAGKQAGLDKNVVKVSQNNI